MYQINKTNVKLIFNTVLSFCVDNIITLGWEDISIDGNLHHMNKFNKCILYINIIHWSLHYNIFC